MGKGYAEGPAAEERFAALERGELDGDERRVEERRAVYGSTKENPAKHFLGWADEVDADDLFARGQAWGLSVVRRAATDGRSGVPRTRDGGTPNG